MCEVDSEPMVFQLRTEADKHAHENLSCELPPIIKFLATKRDGNVARFG